VVTWCSPGLLRCSSLAPECLGISSLGARLLLPDLWPLIKHPVPQPVRGDRPARRSAKRRLTSCVALEHIVRVSRSALCFPLLLSSMKPPLTPRLVTDDVERERKPCANRS
jgi:hypothetical protein